MAEIKRKNKIKGSQAIFIAIGLVFLVHGISLLLPFIWMIITSFKSRLDMSNSFLGLPSVWKWENYTGIFDLLKVEIIKKGRFYEYDVFDMFANSLVLAIFKTFFEMLPCIMCSYCVARYEFKLRKVLFMTNLFVMTIPLQGSLANTLVVFQQFHIYDNLLLYIILPGGCFGFNFLMFYNAYKGISKTYSEAVFLDGGGHLTVFFVIIVPMMLPMFTAIYILGFIGNWNSYSHSLLFLPSVPTLSYGLYEFQYNAAKYGASLPQILAGFTICSIPSVALYIAFQKPISKSLAIGGLKE